MSARVRVLVLVAALAIAAACFQARSQLSQACSHDHEVWVVETMRRMATIRPGMTRQALLTVFRTEGGPSTALKRTFVSRGCSYFKVDVEFVAVGRSNGSRTEDGRDIILTISRPYLAYAVVD